MKLQDYLNIVTYYVESVGQATLIRNPTGGNASSKTPIAIQTDWLFHPHTMFFEPCKMY